MCCFAVFTREGAGRKRKDFICFETYQHVWHMVSVSLVFSSPALVGVHNGLRSFSIPLSPWFHTPSSPTSSQRCVTQQTQTWSVVSQGTGLDLFSGYSLPVRAEAGSSLWLFRWAVWSWCGFQSGVWTWSVWLPAGQLSCSAWVLWRPFHSWPSPLFSPQPWEGVFGFSKWGKEK